MTTWVWVIDTRQFRIEYVIWWPLEPDSTSAMDKPASDDCEDSGNPFGHENDSHDGKNMAANDLEQDVNATTPTTPTPPSSPLENCQSKVSATSSSSSLSTAANADDLSSPTKERKNFFARYNPKKVSGKNTREN